MPVNRKHQVTPTNACLLMSHTRWNSLSLYSINCHTLKKNTRHPLWGTNSRRKVNVNDRTLAEISDFSRESSKEKLMKTIEILTYWHKWDQNRKISSDCPQTSSVPYKNYWHCKNKNLKLMSERKLTGIKKVFLFLPFSRSGSNYFSCL